VTVPVTFRTKRDGVQSQIYQFADLFDRKEHARIGIPRIEEGIRRALRHKWVRPGDIVHETAADWEAAMVRAKGLTEGGT
jgi:hypothetical protein